MHTFFDLNSFDDTAAHAAFIDCICVLEHIKCKAYILSCYAVWVVRAIICNFGTNMWQICFFFRGMFNRERYSQLQLLDERLRAGIDWRRRCGIVSSGARGHGCTWLHQGRADMSVTHLLSEVFASVILPVQKRRLLWLFAIVHRIIAFVYFHFQYIRMHLYIAAEKLVLLPTGAAHDCNNHANNYTTIYMPLSVCEVNLHWLVRCVAWWPSAYSVCLIVSACWLPYPI